MRAIGVSRDTMRERDNRSHRHRPVTHGPSFITKEVVFKDSCSVFVPNYWDKELFRKQLELQRLDAYKRPDPFGIQDYAVKYSLNKKERWTLPEDIGNRIETVQRPDLQLRVSSSRHNAQRAERTTEAHKKFGDKEDHWRETPKVQLLPATEFHDVSREGEAVHRTARLGKKVQLTALMKPEGNPRREKYEWNRRRRWERWNLGDRGNFPVEEKERFQKLHVRYSTVELEDPSPSSYANGHRICKKVDIKAATHQRRTPKAEKELADQIDDVLCNPSLEEAAIEEESCSSLYLPTKEKSFVDFLVAPKQKQVKKKTVKLTPQTIQETIKITHIISMTPSTSSWSMEDSGVEDEEDEVQEPVFFMDDSMTAITVGCLPAIFSSVRMDSLPLAPLPVEPPTWIVHKQDTQTILGKSFGSCVVAKKLPGEELLRLFMMESCALHHGIKEYRDWPSTSSSSLSCSTYMEIGGDCSICTEPMDGEFESSIPFALACGHSYCTVCWLKHISLSMEKGRLPTQCMEPSCTHVLSPYVAQALLSSSSLFVYSKAVEEVLLREQKLVECPNCSRKVESSDSGAALDCPCGFSICSTCTSVHHWPLACDAYGKYVKSLEKCGITSPFSLAASSMRVVSELVVCPSCSTLMQRSEGCNHMSCMCGAQFCHACGKNWSSKHYECNESNYKAVPLIDITTSSLQFIRPSILSEIIQLKMEWNERRKEITKRLHVLPAMRRAPAMKILAKAALLHDLCYVDFHKYRRREQALNRMRFELAIFLNTRDGRAAKMQAKVQRLNNAIEDVLQY